MSDTEKEIDELQRKLAAKTREIEALVVDEEDQGDSYVEELRNDKRRTLIVLAPIPTRH